MPILYSLRLLCFDFVKWSIRGISLYVEMYKYIKKILFIIKFVTIIVLQNVQIIPRLSKFGHCIFSRQLVAGHLGLTLALILKSI